MEKQKNTPNIKVKLLLGFSITIIALVVAGFITYISFTRMVESVEILAEPDEKLIRLNHMLTDISEAEGSFRTYILSDNKEHLTTYQLQLDSIQQSLSVLKTITVNDPGQLTILDSISILIDAKYDALDQLASLKRRSRNNRFTTKALDRISHTSVDSTKIDTTLTTYTETTTHLKPRTVDSITTKKPEEKGFFQAIKNLFSGSNDSEEEEAPALEEEDEYITETTVKVDTNIVTSVQPDTLLSNIKKILSDIQKRENVLNRLLTSKELEILEQDRLIMNKLRVLVTDLERKEIVSTEQQTQQAKAIADKFSFTILAIGIIGLLTGTGFVLLILYDINKSNYYKNQLEKAKTKAEQLAKAKEEFLSNMSHEIRTPLNAILGFTEQLLPTRLEKKQHEYLQAVHQSSEHLLSTVNDILDYSKIEAGKLSFEEIPFKPKKTIREVHALLKLKAEEKNLEFNYFFDEDFPEGLVGDPFRLKQILINLVGNALKFTSSGSIHIIAKCGKAFYSSKKVIVSIEVKDTGIGISEEKLSVIFEDFQQADNTTTRQYGGTGLGLTICKNLAELQNGVLMVESKEGAGSSFIVNIPYQVYDVPIEEEEQAGRQISFGVLKNITVLIVDDDNFNITLLDTILRKYGADTIHAENGQEGMKIIETQPLDLIVTDIQMPHMNGFDFTKAIRVTESINQKTPVIALTAHVTQKEMKEAKDAGITKIISKPFKEMQLLEEICQMLNLLPEGGTAENVPEKPMENTLSSGIDLSSFDNFIKGDKQALFVLLNTLAQDQQKNIQVLNSSIQSNNLQRIAEIAHKMSASFAYLKADSVVEKLKKLELGIREGRKDVAFIPIAQAASGEASRLMEALETEISKMKVEAHFV